MTKVFNYFALAFLLLCLNQKAFAETPAYKLVDLGLTESDSSEATSINDNGQVVGFYWMFGKKHHFLWDIEKGTSLLSLPESTTIKVINNAGQIAGNYYDNGQERGFFVDQDGTFYDIGTLGGDFSRVFAMNDLGQIVGQSECETKPYETACGISFKKERHAFVWHLGLMTDLGTLPGDLGLPGDTSVAVGINNHGVIIGEATYALVNKGKVLQSQPRAVIWKEGVIEELDAKIQYSPLLSDINDAGKIVCSSSPSYLYDGTSTLKIYTNGSVKINEKDDLLYTNVLLYHDNNYNFSKYVHFPDYFNSGDWVSYAGATDFNNKNWVLVKTLNRYGECHSVLFVPAAE